MKKENYFITTAIDYATGNPHLGHAYEKIGTDVIARFQRLLQKETRFLTGTDEHGQKVFEKAQEKNLTPQEFVDIESDKFEKLTHTLNLSNDFFIRTTQKEHKLFVQQMLQKSYDNGDIYLGKYEGLYCVGCEKYYTEYELLEGNICPDHKKVVENVKQENYFFKLSKYENFLLELYEKNPEFISPKHRRDEIINRVKAGLQDISISRPKTSLRWGIEFPFDDTHVTYVWFDALFNYASYGVKENMWPASCHVVGKDIMWFHMVYWPAFLKSVELELPSKVHAHGHILDKDGHKMSKSLDNVVNPFEEIEKYGLDEFKFYLMYLGSFGEDCRYSNEDFIQLINSVLNNGLGNLVSRVYSMTQKYTKGEIPIIDESKLQDVDNNLISKLDIKDEVTSFLETLEINKALQVFIRIISDINTYVNETEPFKVEDDVRRNQILAVLHHSIYNLLPYLSIIISQKVELIEKQFNYSQKLDLELKYLENGIKLGEKIQVFNKIQDNDETFEKVKEKNKFITIKEEKRKEIKAVIFDFDGVIVDNFDGVYNILNEVYGISKEEFLSSLEGNINSTNEKKGKEKVQQVWSKLDELSLENLVEKKTKKELLNLKQNYRLFCVTSNKKENISRVLNHSEIDLDIFEEVYGKEEGNCKSEKINLLLEKYNLKTEEVVFVTDTLGDLREANNSGVLTIAVDYGFHEKERLQKGSPYKIVSSFKAIRKEIDKLSKHTISNGMIQLSEKLESKSISARLHTLHPTQKNKQIAVFVHGFCANKFGCKSEEFKWQALGEGYDFLSFDFLGCGENERYPISITSQIKQVEDILTGVVEKLDYDNILLIGHSLGGLNVLSQKHNSIVKKIVIAPLCFSRSKEEYYSIFNITSDKQKQLKEYKKCEYEEEGRIFELSSQFFTDLLEISQKKLKKIITKGNFETLCIHGTNDLVLPYIEIKNFIEFCNSKQLYLETIEKGTHSFSRNSKSQNEFSYLSIRNFIKEGIIHPKLAFSDLRLQIGKIIDVVQHPEADKLYIEQVDFGDFGVRQIISGLQPYFKKEEMIGKKVLALTNLQTAKLRGMDSQGMLLLAENNEGKLGFITSENSKLGNFVLLGDKIANSEIEISVDDFFSISLESKKEGIFFENEEDKINLGSNDLKVENNIFGTIR